MPGVTISTTSLAAPLQGSTKLCSCTARDGGPSAMSSSGVAMIVISSKLFWKLASSLRA